MRLWSPERVADVLERESNLLGHVFGPGNFRIEEADPDVAIVHSQLVRCDFAYERDRDRQLTTMLTPIGVPEEVALPHPLDTWNGLVGLEISASPRDSAGRVKATLQEQMVSELRVLGRVVHKLFSDPARTRDAAYFAAGYNQAYNDWASRKGSWTEV